MSRREELLQSIIRLTRLVKSALLASDTDVFLSTLDEKELLLQELSTLPKASTSSEKELLREAISLDSEAMEMCKSLYTQFVSGDKKNRREINQIKLTRNIFKRYSIESPSGIRIDVKEK